MSKFSESLGQLRIYNAYGYAANQVMIGYVSADRGRGGHAAKWQIYKGQERTEDEDKGAWYDYGRKTFNIFSVAERAEQLVAAQEWATERYGIKEWAKTPFGSWMDAEFVAKRNKDLRERLRQRAS